MSSVVAAPMVTLPMSTVVAVSVLLLGMVVLAVAVVWAVSVRRRLARLGERRDRARYALHGALDRRCGVVRAVVETGAAGEAGHRERELRRAAQRAETTPWAEREAAENDVQHALDVWLEEVESAPASAREAIADAQARVTLSRRFYNDAVRDARSLLSARAVRAVTRTDLDDWSYFEIDEGDGGAVY